MNFKEMVQITQVPLLPFWKFKFRTHPIPYIPPNNYGVHPSELTIFFYDTWTRNQIKVKHKKFHVSKLIIEEVQK